jgi:hypothetical protein
LGPNKVLTLFALALLGTHDAGLEAFAILLQTFRLPAPTANVVAIRRSYLSADPLFKGVRVLGSGLGHRFLANIVLIRGEMG